MVSGQVLRKMLQNSFRRNDDVDNDDHSEDESDSKRDQYVECYVLQMHVGHGDHRQPWIKHVCGTQPHDNGPTSTTWMATLLHSLQFRLVDHNDVFPSHSPRQRRVYVLDSDLQPPPLTSGSSLKRETERGRSASIVSQSRNVVEWPTARSLPEFTPSSPSSRRTAGNSRRRQNPCDQSDVTFAGTASPQTLSKASSLQSPPLAARYPLRRKIPTACSSPITSTVSSGVEEAVWSPATTGPPPPQLPARRKKLPPTSRFLAHLEPPVTSLLSTEPTSVLSVEPMATSAGKRQHRSETSHNESDDDELNYYKVDVCGTSMLDCVLQAANSLSPSHDITADNEPVSQQLLNIDNSNVDSDDYEPVTPSIADVNLLHIINGSSNLEVIYQSFHTVLNSISTALNKH